MPDRPLHVCFFNRSFHTDGGATGQLLGELAEDLVRDYGCRVSVVAGPAPASSAGEPPGVTVLRAWGTRFSKRSFAGRFANYLSYFFAACVAGLRVERPDVVVALTDPPVIGLAALLAARRHRTRFVFLCQDIFPEAARLLEDFRSEAVNRMLAAVNRLLVRRAEAIVALGQSMRERLVRDKGADLRKVTIIHNWADCAAITPGDKRNPFAAAHGLADKFVVMHSGNIGLSQGLEILVDAARRWQQFPDLRVVVVGDGVKKSQLEEQARRGGLANVLFLPPVAKEMLADSFASADVFVISLRRGLAGVIEPSKLYGILAAGRPYVAAVEDATEVAAITRQFNCGLLAEPESASDLAAKVLVLYQDRAAARQLGANGRAASFQFDRPRQVRAYYELLRSVCQDEGQGHSVGGGVPV